MKPVFIDRVYGDQDVDSLTLAEAHNISYPHSKERVGFKIHNVGSL